MTITIITETDQPITLRRFGRLHGTICYVALAGLEDNFDTFPESSDFVTALQGMHMTCEKTTTVKPMLTARRTEETIDLYSKESGAMNLPESLK